MKRIYLSVAIKRLMILWLCCSLFLLLLMLTQTIFEKYGDESNKAWQWFVVHLLPVNVLILVGYFRHKRLSSLTLSATDQILFRIVFWVSVAYLLAVIMVMLLQPFGSFENTYAVNLHTADTGLYIFQGILLVALGVFIYTTERRFAGISKAEAGDQFAGEPGVFISYNHADEVIANKLREMLENENIPVTIDSKDMLAGEAIKSFIERSVLNNRTTLSVVSKKSLLSGWVGMETINTFFLKKFSKNKQFISCYLDADFFDRGFTASAVESFDQQLKDVNQQIDKHNALGIDTRDLNDFKTRLLSLRNNLDEIIQQLRNTLCVDIRNEKLTENFPLILKSINPD